MWALQLAAQAEAEKQNIGGADYVHKELDKYKNKVEEQEKIHIDINRSAPDFIPESVDDLGRLDALAIMAVLV